MRFIPLASEERLHYGRLLSCQSPSAMFPIVIVLVLLRVIDLVRFDHDHEHEDEEEIATSFIAIEAAL